MSETIESVVAVLQAEAGAISAVAAQAAGQAQALERACDLIRTRCGGEARGRLVVTGIGKAGHIGAKLAATFASTGTPSFFLHPAEARHGDFGMVQEQDVVFALSNSGSSEEVVAMLPTLSHIGVPVIALVGRTDSPLARHAEAVLSIGRVAEACPLGLAPSTSTTAMLALGDAVALTVQRQRRFTPEQYARFHPGGALGRKLMTCAEVMRTGERVPTASPDTPLLDAIRKVTRARSGSVVIVDGERRLLGICTDGDVRRAFVRLESPAELMTAPVSRFATMPCKSVRAGDLLQAALHLCAGKKINELPVVDDEGRLAGLIDIQDLVDRGFEIA